MFFLLRNPLVFLSVCYFPGTLGVRKVRKSLGVFEFVLGILKKTKEKEGQAIGCTPRGSCDNTPSNKGS